MGVGGAYDQPPPLLARFDGATLAIWGNLQGLLRWLYSNVTPTFYVHTYILVVFAIWTFRRLWSAPFIYFRERIAVNAYLTVF